MKPRYFFLVAQIFFASWLLAQDLQSISLPKPVTDGGRPLMQCLKDRRTTREFSKEKIAPQVLSNLLWAAFGINRDDGRRTAPSAMNRQEVDIYVFTESGVYLYDAKANELTPVLPGDHRAATGKQDFVKDAPLHLAYVADYARMGDMSEDDKRLYSTVDVGFIAENAYLFCASEGLTTVARGWVDREELARTLKLRAEQRIILAQTVGYPWK